MESITTESHLFELQVDHNTSAYLKETARWAKFMAILGFVFCGLFVIVAVFAGSIFATAFSALGTAGFGAAGGVFISALYILIALLYFFPCLYLFNFSAKMQTALRNNDQEQLNLSFKNLKSCYRYIGILMIIGLGFWLLAFILMGIGSAFR